MYFRKIPKALFATVFAAIAVLGSSIAIGSENLSPFLPGVTTGKPLGAALPPGLYLVDTAYVASADKLKDGQGISSPLKVRNYVNTDLLLWVPEWKLLGAQYSANIIMLYARHDVDSSALGGYRSRSSGFFNTIVTPITLSWDLGGDLFTSTGLAIYLPGGNYHYAGGKTLQTSYANNYLTLEPNWAISYLHDGWDFTLNNVFDFNRRNQSTDYRSGSAYYLDATATKTHGLWSLGVVGNYSRQFTDDRQYGQVVRDGNRFEHVLVGPLVSYDIGKAKLTLRYLQDVRTRNDVNVSFLYASLTSRL